MNTLRLAAAALAACTTLTLFSAVVAVAEPRRSELLARLPPRTAATVAAATPAPATRVAAVTRAAPR